MGTRVKKIIISGCQDQGALFLGKILADTGVKQNKNICLMPFYAAKAHGPDVNCTVVISEKAVGSPIVSVPEIFIAMNSSLMEEFKTKIKPGGLILFNSSTVNKQDIRDDIRGIGIPVNKLAKKLGDEALATAIMLGAFSEAAKLFSKKEILESIKDILKDKKIISNFENALEMGIKYIKNKEYMKENIKFSIFKA